MQPDTKHNPYTWNDTKNRRGAWTSYWEVRNAGGTSADALTAARVFLEAQGISSEEIEVILDDLFLGLDPKPPP